MAIKFCPHCGKPLSDAIALSDANANETDPNDPYQQLIQLARAIAEQMMTAGKTTCEYKSDDGRTVQGWCIETYGGYQEDWSSAAYIDKYWGQRYLLLTTNGEFLTFGSDNVSEGPVRGNVVSKATTTLEETPLAYLAGSKGKLFSEVVSKLERLPWR